MGLRAQASPFARRRPFHPGKSCGSCSALPSAVPERPGAQRKSPRTPASGRGHASAALAVAKRWSGRAVDLCAAVMIKLGEVREFFHFSFLAFKYLMDRFLRGALLQGCLSQPGMCPR